MSYVNRKILRPFVFFFMIVGLISTCEDFEEQTYEMNELEQAACALLNDTLEVTVETYDLANLSPAWAGSDIEATLTSSERIGESWFDDDHVIWNDVYVFLQAPDTLAAVQFKSLVYDEATVEVDSVEVEWIYNTDGASNFAQTIRDTILITGIMDGSVYFNFETGLVAESDAWQLHFDGPVIKQNTGVEQHRMRGKNLSAFSSAPKTKYYADGLGYDVAMEQLMSDSVYFLEADSLNYLDLSSVIASGFLLWDRTGAATQDLIFNLDEYMSIFIWDESGMLIEPSDNSISMETVAYCNSLKVREVYTLEDEMYLLRFKPHESAEDWSFHLAIVEGD